MKKLLFILLALPILLTAQEKPVQVYSCGVGTAFTIRIPVKFPDSMTVKYMWYRNDTAVTAEATLLPNEKTIAYTIPAEKAVGNSAAFHFRYCIDDECSDVWTRSPVYLVMFAPCDDISGAGTVSVAVCNDISDAGTISDFVCSDVNNAGTVNVTVCNDVSGAGTIAIAACNDISNAGTISILQ